MTFKWLIWNLPIAIIVIDGTIGITPYSEQSANVIPFASVFLFAMSIIGLIVYLISLVYVESDESDLDGLKKIRESSESRIASMKLDLPFDLSIMILMAAFTFYWSAVFFFMHTFISVIARGIRYVIKDKACKKEIELQK